MANIGHPIFLICGLVGFIFGLTGIILLKFPPKKINSIYGYRTKRSMSNKKTWDFAQTYSGRLMAILGFIQMLLCMLSFVIPAESSISITIAIGSVFIVPVVLFIKTESLLKSKFPIA